MRSPVKSRRSNSAVKVGERDFSAAAGKVGHFGRGSKEILLAVTSLSVKAKLRATDLQSDLDPLISVT